MAQKVNMQPEDFIVNKKGQKLFCKYWNEDNENEIARETPKALVFVVHGLGEHCLWYTELATMLIGQGFYVFSHDHVGHGQSEGERAMIKDFDDYVEDLFDHIDAVKKRFESCPVFLLSHSMGGTVAFLAGQKRPDFFQGQLMIGPAFVPDKKLASPFLIFMGKLAAKVYPSLQVKKLDPQATSRDKKVVQKYEDDPLNYHGGIKAGHGLAFLKAQDKIQAEMENVTWPFLVLHGEKDTLCDVEGSRLFYEKAKTQDKQLKTFEDALHQLHGELEPVKTEVFDLIADWLNKRTK